MTLSLPWMLWGSLSFVLLRQLSHLRYSHIPICCAPRCSASLHHLLIEPQPGYRAHPWEGEFTGVSMVSATKIKDSLMTILYFCWSPQPESNWWPHPYHGCALPAELWGHIRLWRYSYSLSCRRSLFAAYLPAKINGAGDGNRTHAVSLGSWYSTIELHPH